MLKMLVKPFTGINFAWNFEIVFSMYDSDTDTNHTSTQCHYIRNLISFNPKIFSDIYMYMISFELIFQGIINSFKNLKDIGWLQVKGEQL